MKSRNCFPAHPIFHRPGAWIKQNTRVLYDNQPIMYLPFAHVTGEDLKKKLTVAQEILVTLQRQEAMDQDSMEQALQMGTQELVIQLFVALSLEARTTTKDNSVVMILNEVTYLDNYLLAILTGK